MPNQSCSYCGLPTPVRQTDSETPVYCCLGCRIAAGIINDDRQSEWTVTRLGMAIFFTMNVMVFTLVLWTWNVHEIDPDARILAFRGILRYACLLFSTPVLILLGGPLVESTAAALRERRLTTDVLLLLGVAAAFGYSIAALYYDSPDVYFEVCCMILVAVTLGKWLEGTAKQKATNAIRSLCELLPTTARVQRNEHEIVTPIEQVAVGDQVRVLPGERIPFDGSVGGETCVVDEQLITGESLPVTKHHGDLLFAGSLNVSHELILTVTSPADHGTIARLVKAVEKATSTSCRSIRLADRLAAWFVPLIIASAIATFALHYGKGVQASLMAAVSVVLIACPCALGIATPMALWVAINSGARHGVLFRDGDAVIRLAKLRSLGLDKTGTVTTGDVRVVSERITANTNTSAVRDTAQQLARSSTHPLSRAIANGVHRIETALKLSNIQDHPGKGITAIALAPDGETEALLGSVSFAKESGYTIPMDLSGQLENATEHNAIVCFGWRQEVKALFLLQDTIRTESRGTIRELQKLGLLPIILTGDTAPRAAEMQQAIGIETIGELLPEDKAQKLAAMTRPVGMVGDGLNDAIALSSADVGIAMDCGADLSRESADVCLLGSTLAQLPWAIRLARATQQTVRRNLVWAIGYNAVGICFAMSGNLNPIIAAVAMVGSSLFVLTSSLALGVAFGSDDSVSHDLPSEASPNNSMPRVAAGEAIAMRPEVEMVP